MIYLCNMCEHGGKMKKETCSNCGDGKNYKPLFEPEEQDSRPEMLPKPVPIYEHDFSQYPEQVRISFSDGHSAVYDLRVEQPHPVIVENIRIIRKWKQGYVNQPERRRRRK